MTTPKQAQEAALLAMIKQLLPEQEILESEIETIYAAVDYIRELSAMLEWKSHISVIFYVIWHFEPLFIAMNLYSNLPKLFENW